MKVYSISFLLVMTFIIYLSSCMDDKGNYDYQDLTDVIAVKIENLPDTLPAPRELVLSPVLKNLKENVEYSYRWIYYDQSAAPPELKELATTKDIAADISFLNAGNYIVTFEVKDNVRDVFVRKQIVLEVRATEVQQGWYLLKDKDNITDIDYINLTGKLYENVLKDYSVGGNLQLKGKAVQMTYDPNRYTHQIIEDGKVVATLTRQKVFHVISDQDYAAINPNNTSLYKRFDQAFFEAPSVVKPQSVAYSSSAIFLQNAGKVHVIASMSMNIGLFGYPAVSNESYSFKGTQMIDDTNSTLVFDEVSRSFRKISIFENGVSYLPDYPEGATNTEKIPSPNNMDADLLEMLQARVTITGQIRTPIYTGVAIMKSTVKNEHYIALMELNGAANYPFVKIDTIRDSNHPVLTSPFRAATREGLFIYYTNSQGNELWSYNYVSKESRLIKTFGSGEKVTYIYNYMQRPTSLNQIAIATSVGGETWKMYQFEKLGDAYPDLIKESENVYEGKGTVRYIMYRSN